MSPFGNRTKSRPAAGFTLIELLVVVAIIALLISILLPSLRCAREQAKTVKCGAQMRGFGTGLHTYFSENNDFIPGVNTSGVAMRAKRYATDTKIINRSDVPVQSFDWMTPLVSYSTELPAERVERWHYLWTAFQCPSIPLTNNIPYSGSNPPDGADFEEKVWPACSYLMPSMFSYWGANNRGKFLSKSETRPDISYFNVFAVDAGSPLDSNVKVYDYRGSLAEIGNASRKVFVADGTRYLPNEGTLDFDHSLAPGSFGAFSSTGAWWGGSTAYGVKPGTDTYDNGTMSDQGGSGRNKDGLNLPLSYRHGCQRPADGSGPGNKGSINVLAFDGHVEKLSDRESREIHWWYPSGAIVENPSSGMVKYQRGYVIP